MKKSLASVLYVTVMMKLEAKPSLIDCEKEEMCGMPASRVQNTLIRAKMKGETMEKLQEIPGDAAYRVMLLYARGMPMGIVAKALGVDMVELADLD